MKKKRRKIGEELIKGMQSLVDALDSGKPIEDSFRVTTIEKVNEFENVVTVKGPKKSENNALQDGKIE
jgi:hypothetical protein